jgi:AcrR family transcriptional regulator
MSVLASEVLGRRERKKRSTRLALRAAALDLVAERGFAHVTVEDIADAVDVSVRTFFNYFTSKEDAVVGDDPELIDATKAELLALPAELSPLEAIRTVLFTRMRAIQEDIDQSGEDHAVWMRRFALVKSQPEVLVAYTKHLTRLEKALTDALVERLGGDERRRLYASVVTSSAIGVMRAASMCAGGTESLLDLAAEAFGVLAGGLDLPPARPRPHQTRRKTEKS